MGLSKQWVRNNPNYMSLSRLAEKDKRFKRLQTLRGRAIKAWCIRVGLNTRVTNALAGGWSGGWLVWDDMDITQYPTCNEILKWAGRNDHVIHHIGAIGSKQIAEAFEKHGGIEDDDPGVKIPRGELELARQRVEEFYPGYSIYKKAISPPPPPSPRENRVE